jgi:hypothetical protein
MRPRWKRHFPPDGAPAQREIEQWTVGRKAPTGLERIKPAAVVERRAALHVHPIHSNRATQRREIRHRVGAGASRESEPAVQDPIPDVRRRHRIIHESQRLVVVHLAKRDVDRKLRRQRVSSIRRIGIGVERMDVPGKAALCVRLIGDIGVRRDEARRGGVGVRRVPG